MTSPSSRPTSSCAAECCSSAATESRCRSNWSSVVAASRPAVDALGAWALLVFRAEMMKLLELDRYGLELLTPRTHYCVFGSPDDAESLVARQLLTIGLSSSITNPRT